MVPKQVHVDDDESVARLSVFDEHHDSDVIARHDAIEYIGRVLHVCPVDGYVGKVNLLAVKNSISAGR